MSKELSDNNAHIPTAEIEKDIADTVVDIARWKREIQAYEILGDRMSIFRADARRSYIKDATQFIEKLQSIVDYRKGSKV